MLRTWILNYYFMRPTKSPDERSGKHTTILEGFSLHSLGLDVEILDTFDVGTCDRNDLICCLFKYLVPHALKLRTDRHPAPSHHRRLSFASFRCHKEWCGQWFLE